MSSLNFRCASIREKSITYENTDSCKQKLVIVQKLHIEYDFSLFFTVTFLFSLSFAPSFIKATSHSTIYDIPMRPLREDQRHITGVAGLL